MCTLGMIRMGIGIVWIPIRIRIYSRSASKRWRSTILVLESSVADPDPGSGAFLTPGSGIPNPYFWELSDNFLGKKLYNYFKIDPNFFLQHFKTKTIFNFVKFVATKKGIKKKIFHFSLLLLFWDPGSEILFCCCFGIRDPRSGMGKNQNPG